MNDVKKIKAHSNKIYGIEMIGDYIITLEATQRIKLWKLKEKELYLINSVEIQMPKAIRLSSIKVQDNEIFIGADNGYIIRVELNQTGQKKEELIGRYGSKRINVIQLIDQGLIIGSVDGKIRLLNPKTLEEKYLYDTNQEKLRDIKKVNADKLLALYDNGLILSLNIKNEKIEIKPYYTYNLDINSKDKIKSLDKLSVFNIDKAEQKMYIGTYKGDVLVSKIDDKPMLQRIGRVSRTRINKILLQNDNIIVCDDDGINKISKGENSL
ncbi:MAG: hypothetical protein ACOCRO_10370, partial [Halanaerobiales bacterium]